jgi:hypothetical protein
VFAHSGACKSIRVALIARRPALMIAESDGCLLLFQPIFIPRTRAFVQRPVEGRLMSAEPAEPVVIKHTRGIRFHLPWNIICLRANDSGVHASMYALAALCYN